LQYQLFRHILVNILTVGIDGFQLGRHGNAVCSRVEGLASFRPNSGDLVDFQKGCEKNFVRP